MNLTVHETTPSRCFDQLTFVGERRAACPLSPLRLPEFRTTLSLNDLIEGCPKQAFLNFEGRDIHDYSSCVPNMFVPHTATYGVRHLMFPLAGFIYGCRLSPLGINFLRRTSENSCSRSFCFCHSLIDTLLLSSNSLTSIQTCQFNMKLNTILASLAAIAYATASPTEKRGGYGNCLTDEQANTIVAKYASILEGVEYQGQSPNVTAEQVVAKNYVEYSDSILSLEDAPVSKFATYCLRVFSNKSASSPTRHLPLLVLSGQARCYNIQTQTFRRSTSSIHATRLCGNGCSHKSDLVSIG
jgi:hypothetical protein